MISWSNGITVKNRERIPFWSGPSRKGPLVLIPYPCFFPPHQAHCFRIDTPMNSNGGMIHMTRFAMERAQPLPSILGVSHPSPHEAVSDHFITLTGFMLLLQLKEVQWFQFFFFFPDFFCLNWYSVLPVRGLLSLEILTEMQMFNHQMVWVGRDL